MIDGHFQDERWNIFSHQALYLGVDFILKSQNGHEILQAILLNVKMQGKIFDRIVSKSPFSLE